MFSLKWLVLCRIVVDTLESTIDFILNEFFGGRLLNVVLTEERLYLIFEYLDMDLKKHMESSPEFLEDPQLVKVSTQVIAFCIRL